MKDAILEQLRKIYPLSDETFELIKPLLIYKRIKKNSILCNIGESPVHVYYIIDGIIRAYVETPKGGTYIKSIFTKNQFAGPYTALVTNKPSKIVYETLTDCDLFMINHSALMSLCYKHQDLLKFTHRMFEIYYVSLESRVINLGSLTAKERYLDLKSKLKQIENEIPQYHIASLLGITPIQLSRIRKELLSGN